MNLKDYLNQIICLEKSIYTIKKLIEKLDYKIKYWQMPSEIPYPNLVKKDELYDIYDEKDVYEGWKAEFFLVGMGSLIGGTIFNVIVSFIAHGLDSMVWDIKQWCLTYLISIMILGIGDFLLTKLSGSPVYESKVKTAKILADIEESNMRKLAEYNEKVQVYNEKLNFEKIKREKMIQDRNRMYNRLEECQNTLSKLYATNIIYPKYRNFVAVTSFCEYLNSGRCTVLEGHEGAYNIYENELRQNMIISQLSEVIKNLEGIRSNQYMMYQTIKEANNQAEKIYQSSLQLLDIENANAENIALTEYNTRIAAFNTSVLRDIALYDHIVE